LADEHRAGEKAEALAVAEFDEDVAVAAAAERPREEVDGGCERDQPAVRTLQFRQHGTRIEIQRHEREREERQEYAGADAHPAGDPRTHRQLPPEPEDLASHPEHVTDEVDFRVAFGLPLDRELGHLQAGPLGADQ